MTTCQLFSTEKKKKKGTLLTNIRHSPSPDQIVASYKDDTTLFGRTKAEAGLVYQWIHFADNELSKNVSTWIAPIRGFLPYNKPAHEAAVESLRRALGVLNKILITQTYLVGESITLADISVACALIQPYKMVFDKEFRKDYKNVNRWFLTAVNQKHFKAVIGDIALCEVAEKYVAPKKEEKKKEEKKPKEEKPKEEKKKEKKKEEEDDYDDEPKPEPKPKSALDSLPPS